VIVRFVGEILGGIRQSLAVVIALLAETSTDAATTLEQILCAAGSAIGVVTCALADLFAGVAELALDFTMSHRFSP
jgi:hypothetical protein